MWIRHRRFCHDVGALVDGELDPGRERQLRAHVRKCWTCSGTAELVALVRAALRRSRRNEPAPLAVHRLVRFSHGLATGRP